MKVPQFVEWSIALTLGELMGLGVTLRKAARSYQDEAGNVTREEQNEYHQREQTIAKASGKQKSRSRFVSPDRSNVHNARPRRSDGPVLEALVRTARHHAPALTSARGVSSALDF